MKTRIISACIMLPLLILVYLGGWFIMAAAFAVAVMGAKELCRGFEAAGNRPSYAVVVCSAAGIYGIGAASVIFDIQQWPFIMLWLTLSVMACLLYGFNVEERKAGDMPATVMAVVYVVFFSYHIVLIDQSPCSDMIWLVFLTAFGTDIMAYFTGMAIGKHKLCPKLSPKKSVEGAVGGVAGSVIFCGIFGWLVMPELLTECLVIGAIVSVAAQLGDLSASAFKRQMGIKDYGNLIPGHGGILDRFDSVLFTAPMVYYCIIFINM